MPSWPEQHTEFWQRHPPAVIWRSGSWEGAKKRMARLWDYYRQRRLEEAEDEPLTDEQAQEAALEKRAYFRGPEGQRDRETLWKGGLGTLGPRPQESGLMLDPQAPSAHKPKRKRR